MQEIYEKEKDFEEALIDQLTHLPNQWEPEILEYKTEKELIRNWADILFENNKGIDRLNGVKLTDTEMDQILEQVEKLKTPLRLNGFINGGSVSIKRDNPLDKEHLGKEISLKIFSRDEIAAGQSRYQIARQPLFKALDNVSRDKRGDLMLLINGMPVIHIELKRSGVPVSKAYNQIEYYSHEHVFTGLFSLVQVFVAMTPDETVYFANPGVDGKFNPQYYFHWADFNNDQINYWRDIAEKLLSIPMAHQLIGFYTIADDNDGALKVLRSYQYFAVNKIVDKVKTHDFEGDNQKGGYIWHTTGSGKTMTSFKAAQLIANSNDADKVVFLIDRIELGTQSAIEYRSFAEDTDYIQETESTSILIGKLKSEDIQNKLIVTSIQKMSNITTDEDCHIKNEDLNIILSKRIVFIVDECHRDTFGEMMRMVKSTFKKALFFGFTGTPIQEENKIKGSTTADVFGNELHRYSIADGIRDKNVLGFDTYKIMTFDKKEVREEIALEKAKAKTMAEAIIDPNKSKIIYEFFHNVDFAGKYDSNGKYIKGLEDYLLESGTYRTDEHREKVIQDIKDNYLVCSHNGKFHSLFATSSIPEAIKYYDMLKKAMPDLNISALFDPSIDNNGQQSIKKEDALKDIVKDYNTMFGTPYDISKWSKMKKDMQLRLAHKKQYKNIENDKKQQLNILIVVDQLLTGYDSRWINTLYLDKMLENQNIIQAFSRTNRLFGYEKKHGIIRYYRAPYTMERRIDEALNIYSGNKPFGIFVNKLYQNIENMNAIYTEIKNIFKGSNILNFSKLPDEIADIKKFIDLFNKFNEYLESAKVQGFTWEKQEYTVDGKDITLLIDETIYNILVRRYKEAAKGGTTGPHSDSPYDLKGYLTELDTKEINSEYMNLKFTKYMKALVSGDNKQIESIKKDLLSSFAVLSQQEQKFAMVIIHDIETGDLRIDDDKSIRDLINEYIKKEEDDIVSQISNNFGIDKEMLIKIIHSNINEDNYNEYNRFENLCATCDIDKVVDYFSKKENKEFSKKDANQKMRKYLMEYIINRSANVN